MEAWPAWDASKLTGLKLFSMFNLSRWKLEDVQPIKSLQKILGPSLTFFNPCYLKKDIKRPFQVQNSPYSRHTSKNHQERWRCFESLGFSPCAARFAVLASGSPILEAHEIENPSRSIQGVFTPRLLKHRLYWHIPKNFKDLRRFLPEKTDKVCFKKKKVHDLVILSCPENSQPPKIKETAPGTVYTWKSRQQVNKIQLQSAATFFEFSGCQSLLNWHWFLYQIFVNPNLVDITTNFCRSGIWFGSFAKISCIQIGNRLSSFPVIVTTWTIACLVRGFRTKPSFVTTTHFREITQSSSISSLEEYIESLQGLGVETG